MCKGAEMITKADVLRSLNLQAYYSEALQQIGWNGKSGLALCPFHDDKQPSLSVSIETGTFHCFGCNEKGSVVDFHMRRNGLDFKDALADLARCAGIEADRRQIAATYDYTDEDGKLLFQVIRYEPKDFKQRRPDANGGWIWNLEDIRIVPYRLPEVIRADTVFIVEGEKDVETLRALGLAASCNAGGAGKWREAHAASFTGKSVIILPDNDNPGRTHAEKVAGSLKGLAKPVKVVSLPELPEKGDVSDWLSSGHGQDELQRLIEEAPEWERPKEDEVLSRLTRFADLRKEDTAIEYVVEGLVPKGSITTIVAKAGFGKTYLVMNLLKAVETGTLFLGLKTEPIPGYYADFENPRAVMKERADELDLDSSYLWHIGDTDPPPRFDSKQYTDYLKLPPGLLLVDSLRACQSGDENSSQDMAEVMSRAKEMRDYGHTVLFLIHTTKANERQFRGSLAILDQVDHVLNFYPVRNAESGKPIETDDAEDLDGLTFYLGTREKTRYKPFQIYVKRAGRGKFTLAEDPVTEKMHAIQEVLRTSGPMNQMGLIEKLKDELGLKGDKKIRKLLKDGTGKFWVTQPGEKNSTMFSVAVSPPYRGEKNCQTETGDFGSSDEGVSGRASKGVDNTEFGRYSGVNNQTAKQDFTEDGDFPHEEDSGEEVIEWNC
jgi:hypothetical protein